MDGFSIREARRNDLTAIGELWYELMSLHRRLDSRFHCAQQDIPEYTRHTYRMMKTRDARVLVVEWEKTGEVVGYLIGELQPRVYGAVRGVYGFVSDVFISEEYRRHGVGHTLFAEIKRWFVLRGATSVQLYASVANTESQAFWKAMGLEPYLTLLHLDL
ncbi:MAG: GNAT family N-acetyltransferase [Armatimonadetes bacterium]|nr:GNAT family N-acetyltransferase [Armatimonadota bacterium]